MGRDGKKIKFRPHIYGRVVEGVIIWVHPKHRFVNVEYRVPTPYGMSPPIVESLKIIGGRVETNV